MVTVLKYQTQLTAQFTLAATVQLQTHRTAVAQAAALTTLAMMEQRLRANLIALTLVLDTLATTAQ